MFFVFVIYLHIGTSPLNLLSFSKGEVMLLKKFLIIIMISLVFSQFSFLIEQGHFYSLYDRRETVDWLIKLIGYALVLGYTTAFYGKWSQIKSFNVSFFLALLFVPLFVRCLDTLFFVATKNYYREVWRRFLKSADSARSVIAYLAMAIIIAVVVTFWDKLLNLIPIFSDRKLNTSDSETIREISPDLGDQEKKEEII